MGSPPGGIIASGIMKPRGRQRLDGDRQLLEWVGVFLDRVQAGRANVVLTGAGVSTASGIPDFRGPDGLYSRLSPQTFERDFFFADPHAYYRIAVEHIHTLADCKPNVTHTMLAQLEKREWIRGIVTQNIDGLHQKAGSQNVVEFHGDVLSYHCVQCERPFDRAYVDSAIRAGDLPRCTCGGLIRPGIVFFGDAIPMEALAAAQTLASKADVFIAMGSSLEVNPAAALAFVAHQAGATLMIINRGPTRYDAVADLRFDVDLTAFSEAVLNRLDDQAKE